MSDCLLQILLAWAIVFVPAHPPPKHSGCACVTLKRTGGFCLPCKAGYIADLRITSAVVIEALDTHGHIFIADSLECPSCRRAAARNGRCTTCHRGFVGNKIYASKITYYLALGQPIEGVRPSCAKCRSTSGSTGWCTECKKGWIAHYAYGDFKVWQVASTEYGRLRTALKSIETCEYCVLARYADRICIKCKTQFKNGRTAPRSGTGE
jgi:hypothetical protein